MEQQLEVEEWGSTRLLGTLIYPLLLSRIGCGAWEQVPYLTAAEEDELVEFLTKCAAGENKREFFNIVERTLKSSL